MNGSRPLVTPNISKWNLREMARTYASSTDVDASITLKYAHAMSEKSVPVFTA